jgi:hypothetical protein
MEMFDQVVSVCKMIVAEQFEDDYVHKVVDQPSVNIGYCV